MRVVAGLSLLAFETVRAVPHCHFPSSAATFRGLLERAHVRLSVHRLVPRLRVRRDGGGVREGERRDRACDGGRGGEHRLDGRVARRARHDFAAAAARTRPVKVVRARLLRAACEVLM